MTPLVWHQVGLSVWRAWTTEDGLVAPLSVELARTHLGYRLVLRDPATANETLTVGLNHVGWSLEEAQALADVLLALVRWPTGAPELPVRVLRPAEPVAPRCHYVHAFPPGAPAGTFCQCGRVSRRLSRRAS